MCEELIKISGVECVHKAVLGGECVERGRVESDKSRTDIRKGRAAFYLSVIIPFFAASLSRFTLPCSSYPTRRVKCFSTALEDPLNEQPFTPCATYVTLVVMKTHNDFEEQNSVHREATSSRLSLDITLLLRSES
jgi:hypothetical protein